MTIKNKNLFIKIYLVLYPLICGVITFVNFGVRIMSPVLDISLIIMFCILSVIYILLLYIYRRNLEVHEKIFYYSLYIVFLILMLKIKYCWIIILLLAPLNYLLHKNKSEVRVIITLAISLFIIFIYCFIAFINWLGSFGESIGNVQEYHHYSPDKKYVAVEYLNNSGALGGDEWVTLYKTHHLIF